MQNNFIFRGVITRVEALQSGESQNGTWNRINFVMTEVGSMYPQTVRMSAKSDLALNIRDNVTANDGTLWEAKFSFATHSYERDGQTRSITDINCWSLGKVQKAEKI